LIAIHALLKEMIQLQAFPQFQSEVARAELPGSFQAHFIVPDWEGKNPRL
jgi:hypothetical protein